MTIKKFREELKLLGLKAGDGISILYRAGAEQRPALGDFVGVTNSYPCRLQFLDFDAARTLRSICYRNILKIERSDWHEESCE